MKKSRLMGIVCGCALGVAQVLALSTVNAAPINVAVIYGGGATSAELAAQLNDDTFFDFSATSITADLADTTAELSLYDVVILGDSGISDNGYSAAMFSAVRSFMESGGGVVTTGWYNYATDFFSGQMAIDSDFITPIDVTLGGYNFAGSGGTVDILQVSHDITSGISDFAFNGDHIEYETGVDLNAIQLGALLGNGSAVTIAYQNLVGRSVYLGGQYLANEVSYNNAGLRTGVEDQLLEQSVAWASGGSISAVPVPAAVWLFGSGLLGLVGIARRKKAAYEPGRNTRIHGGCHE